ncbi:hypothetical protein Zm00014a_040833 [Zea mays]|uniref:Uncharacterized protein n=1 Tax=Zea mays TaxID=4577 RepID=A0A317YIM2_MAIZE|nr:hypothetical protein Zm00014a_040833 [Zea mays]
MKYVFPWTTGVLLQDACLAQHRFFFERNSRSSVSQLRRKELT